MACEYASTTTCECRVLQVSCHTLLALQLRQLHVALHGAGWVAEAGVEEAAFGAQSCGCVSVTRPDGNTSCRSIGPLRFRFEATSETSMPASRAPAYLCPSVQGVFNAETLRAPLLPLNRR